MLLQKSSSLVGPPAQLLQHLIPLVDQITATDRNMSLIRLFLGLKLAQLAQVSHQICIAGQPMATAMAKGPFQIDAFLVPSPADAFQLQINGRQFFAPVLWIRWGFRGGMQWSSGGLLLSWQGRLIRFRCLSLRWSWSWGWSGGCFRCNLRFALRLCQRLLQPLPGTILRLFRAGGFAEAAGDTALSIPGFGTHDAAQGVDMTQLSSYLHSPHPMHSF